MKTFICSRCKQEIPKGVSQCPYCQKKYQTRTEKIFWYGLFISLIVAIIVVGSSQDGIEPTYHSVVTSKTRNVLHTKEMDISPVANASDYVGLNVAAINKLLGSPRKQDLNTPPTVSHYEWEASAITVYTEAYPGRQPEYYEISIKNRCVGDPSQALRLININPSSDYRVINRGYTMKDGTVTDVYVWENINGWQTVKTLCNLGSQLFIIIP